MELYIKKNLALITLVISVITLGLGISHVSAIFPFDEFMTPKTDESENQSSEDPFKSQLPGEDGLLGEHGESTDDDSDSYIDSRL
jgi:hypothetical protein